MTKNITIDFSATKDPKKIIEALALRSASLVYALYGDKPITHHYNGEVRVGTKGSLSIKPNGLYFCHEDNSGGNLLQLIMHELECNFAESMKFAIQFIGDNNAEQTCYENPSYGWYGSDTKKVAEALWDRSDNDLTPFIKYLCSRGINEPNDYLLHKLGFLNSHKHTDTNTYHPCGVVKLEDCNENFTGVLRTYLSKNYRSKANVKPNKMALGSTRGAAMQLCIPKRTLYITEGLENALSLMQLDPEIAVWGYVGSSILHCQFPAVVKKVVIATDADEAGDNYRLELCQRLYSEGYQVAILLPDGANDFNEMIQKGK